MSQDLLDLLKELINDRANAADIPLPTTEIIDKIEDVMKREGLL